MPILFNTIVYIFLPEDLDKNQNKLRGLFFVGGVFLFVCFGWGFFSVAVIESVLKSFFSVVAEHSLIVFLMLLILVYLK